MLNLSACSPSSNESSTQQSFEKGTFGYDLQFLQKHQKDLIVLGENEAQILVSPAYQGRVMTSTAEGNTGASFGWINHELIASGKFSPHFSAFGGEERFWLGPEGGQFSIYFKKGVPFNFDNWFVPKEIDTEPFTLISSSKNDATFEKEFKQENYSGNKFELKVNRKIQLLTNEALEKTLPFQIPASIKVVGFESQNTITNTGKNDWDKKSGMLSIWILSMLNASEKTTIALPYNTGDESNLGKIVTDDYFGKVPKERLSVNNGLILLKADAKYRSKIGISPKRAKDFIASYDATNQVLTIAQFSLPKHNTEYVNSLWEIQDQPFSGDAANAYNDGPIDGKQMGNFYEIESSSPAAALKSGMSIQHVHKTFHLKGSKEDLNQITLKLLGVQIDAIALK